MRTTQKKIKYYYVVSGNIYDHNRKPLQGHIITDMRFRNLRTCKETIKMINSIKYIPGDFVVIYANIDGVKYIKNYWVI